MSNKYTEVWLETVRDSLFTALEESNSRVVELIEDEMYAYGYEKEFKRLMELWKKRNAPVKA